MGESLSEVTVCLALPDRQEMWQVSLHVPRTIAQLLVELAPQLSAFDPLWPNYSTAIFGKACAVTTLVNGGEQIELLRPLVADPKQARQRRVELRRKAMGRTAWRRNSRVQKVESTSD
jgi:uncharacterized protein